MDDRSELMGHSVASVHGRELYGDDMTLERKLEVGLQIALPVPVKSIFSNVKGM